MSNRCRICLDEVPKLYPINGTILNCDEEINTMIKYCTSIELELSEDLPDGICVPCFKTLRIAYNFIVQFKENHDKLLQEREIMISPDNTNNLKQSQDYKEEDLSQGGSQEMCEIQEIDLEPEEQVEYELVEQDQEQELVEQEFVEQELVEQEADDEDEYEYQEVEVENLGDFLNSLDENGASTSIENYQRNVTVKIIKTEVPLEGDTNHKPQTVLRRKIKVRFSCPVCISRGKSAYYASFESGLLPHMSLHKESFQCNICVDGTFYNSDTFLNHFMKFHRFQCPYCGKSFNRTGTLTAHIKTHSNFRYYCTTEGCSKSFPTAWTLKKHEAIHSTHSAYFCSECKLEFKTYDTYMYHQKKHNGKKFLCMCCGRTFMQSVHLKYHMQQHTGIKHFKCDMCVKSYTSSSQLKKHKKRHHTEQTVGDMWERIEIDPQEYGDVI